MQGFISRQAAIDATTETVFVEYEENADKEESIIRQTKAAIRDRIKALPPVYVPEMNVGDMISRKVAMERLMAQNVIMDGSEYHNGFNAGVNRAQEVIRNLPTVQPKNGTLIIPLNESDFKSVKRIMLDNKPWCRMFYEDAPGEAHWIKKYTPDDGEVYECDNCGVTWQFNDGGPEENEAFYCPKCGFEMVRGEAE